jgi:hypothetical protein
MNPNQFLAPSILRLAGALSVTHDGASPKVINRDARSEIDPRSSLPVVSTQTRNLFLDTNNANLHWYLPDVTLADGVDPSFAFAASQSGQDSSGNPFNTAQLTFRVQKCQPADVAQFAQSNSGATLREIPLLNLSVALTSVYTDGGQERQRTFTATLQDAGGEAFQLTFGPILGASVVGLYQDLTSFGKAFIIVSSFYQASLNGNIDYSDFPPDRGPGDLAMSSQASPPNRFAATVHPATVSPVRSRRAFAPILVQREANVIRPEGGHLVQTKRGWERHLPLGLKYKQDGYQLKYTVSTVTVPPRVIRDANDLKDFSLRQSEFTELKALGDISQKYPSLSRAYLGVLSRTIVVIPRRYSVVRSQVGCAAQCMALVDSAASSDSKCQFEFDFTIAPEVSRIEFLRLAQEISNRAELKDCTLKFPDFQHHNPPSTLQTTFKSNVEFNAGTEAHTFAITVAIHDDGTQAPAVANANLFIMRLCDNTGAELVGSMSLKLDDGYPDEVLSTIVLNFSHTAGTDELAVQIDEASAKIKLTNQSPLDLQLSRYALIEGSALTEVPGTVSLPANGSLSVPLPTEHAGLLFAADSQLVVPKPMTKSDVAKFLHFQTADVQETQYVVAVNGSGVDFKKVDSLLASITFSTLPNVAPRTLKLNQNVHADSTHIVIPLQNAVFSLPGTVKLTVHFVDRSMSDRTFTVDHDFTSEPVLIVLQSDIDKKQT